MLAPLRAVRLAAVALCCAGVAHAQAPLGADRLSPGAAAESLKVLQQLDSTVRASAKDGAAWFRRGMVAWALSERAKHEPKIPGISETPLRTKADESLRNAVNLQPANAYYWLMTGKFLLSSGISIARAASYTYFEKGLAAARASSDPYVHSEIAVEEGRVYWRRYDALADRWTRVGPGGACEPFTGVMGAVVAAGGEADKPGRPEAARIMRDELSQCALPDKGQSGADDYLRAEELFREAFAAQPSNQRAYSQLAMLLLERKRWGELASTARARLKNAPWDAYAWLTLGLASHRQGGDLFAVAAAFDSALSLMSDEAKMRINHLERVFNPRDTARFAAQDPATRFALNRSYWLTATPLWSRPFDEPQLEFLSRVTYAELRWTVEELNVHGADTDRGDVYIRYGPPDLIASLRGGDDPMNPIYTKWTYDVGMVFTFVGQPTFATAQIPPDYQADFAELTSQIPVKWRRPEFVIDSMPSQIARFRAQDSIDVFVAALPPIAAIKAAAEAAGTARTDFWLLAGGTVSVAHDSVLPATDGVQVFTHRVAPRNYLMRTEASAEGSVRGARASTAFGADDDPHTGFATHGFGISDALIATRAEEKTGTPHRWTDLDISPAAGPVSAAQPISLVWENYGFGGQDGSMKYGVTITLQREQTSTARVAAKITGALAKSVGIDLAPDRVTLKFDRTVPFAPIAVDNIAISLADTPPGSYRVTLVVTDQVTGKSAARTTSLVIK